MRTLDRYIIRQVIPPFLLALAILTFLLAVLPLMPVAQSLLTKGVPVLTVVALLVDLIPSSLGLTIPMALLIGLLMALGRMSADREMVALLACGVSQKRLLRPIGVLAAIAMVATLYVMIEAIPAGNQQFRQTLFSLLEQTTAQEIRPRQFFTAFTGKVLLVQDIDTSGVWHRVTVADTRQSDRPIITLAQRGRLVVRREARAIDIELFDLTRYAPGADPAIYTISPEAQAVFTVDAHSIFDNASVGPDPNSMTIAELKEGIAQKKIENDNRKPGEAPILPHTLIMNIQQKFSFPLANFVMALLALGFGVHTRKEGKFAGFALGLAVILVYYMFLNLAKAVTKAEMFPAVLAPWVPNILLGLAGVALLWWQSKGADRGVSLRMPASLLRWWIARRASRTVRSSRVILVVRIPRFGFPRPRLLDMYVSAHYVRTLVLSFVGLLAVFYISTFVDLSDKLFSKTAGYRMLFEYLAYQTPQFIYWIVPIAVLVSVLVTLGALTKSSELTVMRACGISLYRASAPLLVLALVWAGALFLLEERIMPDANRHAHKLEDTIRGRTPLASLDDRHWLIGQEDRLYYYQAIDTHQGLIRDLSLFEFAADGFHLARHTYAERVVSEGGAAWLAQSGWVRSFPRAGTSRRQMFQNQPLTLEPIGAFVAEPVDASVMSFSDLYREVARRAASGFTVAESAVQLHGKLAFPLVTLVMTLIAIPFAVTHGRRGALYGIGVGIALALSYRLAIVFFAAIGSAGLLSPIVAAWAPNLLFVAGALVFLLTVRT